MRAVIYARFSSHNQRDESIDGQVRVCTEFAKKNDMQIIEVYADRAFSGKTDARPEFQRMIKDSSKGRFEAVLCYAVDRFARNRYDAATYKNKLKVNGVRVYYATSPMNDNPESILLESVMEGLAEYYSENLSRSIKRGMMENALECKVVGGSVPLGYKVGADHKYEIDTAGAQLVRTIFDMYASGSSALEICQALNEQGARTSKGAKFNKNSLHTILSNTKYIGRYTYHDVVIEHGIPQIIPDDLFEKVQAQLKIVHSARGHKKAKHEEYLLTTKCFCGHCKMPMVGESGTSKSGDMHYYYKCVTRKRDRSCQKKIERKTPLEVRVVEFVKHRVLTDETIEEIAARAAELMAQEAADNTILTSLKAQLSDVNNALKNILRAIEMGIINDDTKQRMEELQALKADLLLNIDHEEAEKPILSKDQIAFWLTSFKKGDTQNEEYRRRIIDTLVNCVYVYDTDNGKEIVIVCNLSGQNTFKIECSDFEGSPPPFGEYPNTICYIVSKLAFGIFLHIEAST